MKFIAALLMNIPFLFLFFVILFITIKILINNVKSVAKSRNYTVSSDGHLVRPEDNLTCEKEYGHNHAKTAEPRYIVHQEATDGYVVLNGVKRKISECKNL